MGALMYCFIYFPRGEPIHTQLHRLLNSVEGHGSECVSGSFHNFFSVDVSLLMFQGVLIQC